jgi:osmotically-inducible protein OsmY
MGETQPVGTEDHIPEVREPAGYGRSDADIAFELREHLADDVGLDARGIEIEVKGCEVTMRGAVRNCDDVKRAEGHACAIPGVRLVRNELQPKDLPQETEAKQTAGAASRMGKPHYER